jgi:hypothetical protein
MRVWHIEEDCQRTKQRMLNPVQKTAMNVHEMKSTGVWRRVAIPNCFLQRSLSNGADGPHTHCFWGKRTRVLT